MAKGIAFQFLDVGMGDCTLVEMPPYDGGQLWLVDFGERGSPFKIGPRDATQYLVTQITLTCKNRGLLRPRLDRLFITHPDQDHWNKLGWLIDGKTDVTNNMWQTAGWPANTTLEIGILSYGGNWSEYENRDQTLADQIWNAAGARYYFGDADYDRPNAHNVVSPRWTVNPGGGNPVCNVYLLSSNLPSRGASATNPKSTVLMFEYRTFKVIITGDAEGRVVEPTIIDNYKNVPNFLNCYGLKLGHHGSAAATTEDWVDAVDPHAIFGSGDRRWGHPYCAAIQNCIDWGSLDTGGNRWYSCSKTGGDLDYVSRRTSRWICMNLWYVVTAASETRNGPWGSRTYFQGMYTGVQYRLGIDTNSTPLLTVTNQWPSP